MHLPSNIAAGMHHEFWHYSAITGVAVVCIVVFSRVGCSVTDRLTLLAIALRFEYRYAIKLHKVFL